MFNKKGVGPIIIATVMLLVTVVIAATTFQGWFATYSSSIETNSKTQVLTGDEVQIKNMVGNSLYIKNSAGKEFTINAVEVGGVNCNINQNISTGLINLDLSNCAGTIGVGQHEVLIYTDNGILSEIIFFDESISNEPIIDFNVNVSTVIRHALNTPFNISWNVTKADNCTATTGDWTATGPKNLNGSETYNIDGDASFTLSCDGFGETFTQTINLLGKTEGGIYSCQDLQDMNNDLTGTYYLMNDVDCSETYTWNWNGSHYLGFDPIGDQAVKFTGIFYGQKNSISDLYIYRPAEISVGLFGKTQSSNIYNVSVNANITGYGSIGVLAGGLYDGDVRNVKTTGSVFTSNGTSIGGLIGWNQARNITNCYSNVTITSTYDTGFNPIGGLSGIFGQGSFTYLTNSYSIGKITSIDPAGGLTGYGGQIGFVTNSFWDNETSTQATSNYGTGKNTTEMTTAQTFVDAGWDENIWYLEDGEYPKFVWEVASNKPTVTFNVDVSTTTRLAFNTAYDLSWSGTNIDSCNATQGDWTALGTKSLSDSESYNINGDVTFTLKCDGASGSVTKTISLLGFTDGKIYICSDLETLNNDFFGDYLLMNDIDCSETSTWNWNGSKYLGFIPIANGGSEWFKGTLDGGGHTISNLYINTSARRVGIFEKISNGGEVRNLNIVNASYTNFGSSTTSENTLGGVSGYLNDNSYINNVTFNGDLYLYSTEFRGYLGGIIGDNRGKIYNSSTSGTFTGDYHNFTQHGSAVSGIAGYNNDMINRTYSTATINLIGNPDYTACATGISGDNWGEIHESYSKSDINSVHYGVGGISCRGYGKIYNSYSLSNLTGDNGIGGLTYSLYDTGDEIVNSYFAGTINYTVSTSNVGGLIGVETFSPSVNDSFWDLNTTNISVSDGGIGKNTTQMQTAQTFIDAGWDETIWTLQDGEYPKFVWEEISCSGNDVILDSNLCWQKNFSSAGKLSWALDNAYLVPVWNKYNSTYFYPNGSSSNYPAFEYCENLVLDGYSNWQLPLLSEHYNLLLNGPDYSSTAYSKGIVNIQEDYYWTSTNVGTGNYAMLVRFTSDDQASGQKITQRYVACVREK